RLDEVIAQTETLVPALAEAGSVLGLTCVRACEARVLTEQGRDAGAAAEEALRLAREAENSAFAWIVAATAAPPLLAAGRTGAARELLADVAAGNHDEPEYALELPALARAAFQAGDPELVARLADAVPEALPV